MLGLAGLVVTGTAASAHANIVTATAACAVPAGSGSVVTWHVANDYNLSEVVTVSDATGGAASVAPQAFSIAASGNGHGGDGTTPYTSATLVQTLPATTSGTDTLTVSSTYSDGFTVADSGSVTLLSGCSPVAPPTTTTTTVPPVVQSISGNIYLCSNAQPTTTEQPVGSLGATGPEVVVVAPNPLAPSEVSGGAYTMTATAPAGFRLVACGGDATPDASGSSATEAVDVPIGGTAAGVFYVTADLPGAITIAKQVCGSSQASACGAGGAGPWTTTSTVPAGDTAYWRVTVTNTGQTPISAVTVNDALDPACSEVLTTPLAAGASFSTYCSSADVRSTVTNVASVTFAGQVGAPLASSAQVTTVAVEQAATSALPQAVAPAVTG